MRRNHPASAARVLCSFSIPAWLLLTVVLFFLPLFSTVAETAAPWFFLPTFKHQITGLQQITAKDITAGATPSVISAFVARTPELTEEGKKLLVWRAATFPHQDFVKLMPQNNVFGWYAHVFDQPSELQGLDLLLDLGVIDDSDETFLNGTLIGKTGSVPGGSAWNTDRLYRIPAELITEKGNVLASHAWSQWGLGGIVGPPVLKAALVPSDAQWELAFIKDEKAPMSGLNRVKSADDALSLCFGETAPAWQKAAMPWAGWMNWPDDAHFAVFRTTLNLPKKSDQTAHFHSPVVLDIGPVFDVAAVFLNGRRIGLTGRFQEDGEPAFTEAARRGQYLIAPQDWNVHGDNRLTVVIYRERGIGGLPGVPGILLENPVKPLRRNPSVAECFTSFDILHQSQMYSDAEQSLDEAKPDNDLDQVWLLSHRAHLAWLRWLDGERDEAMLDGMLKPIHEILTKYPVESPKQSAMQAFCRVLRLAEKDEALLARVRHYFPDFSKDCRYLKPDRLTKGDWQMYYGEDLYILAAMGQVLDWSGTATFRHKPQYRLSIPGDKDKARLWLAKEHEELDAPEALLMHGQYKQKLATLSNLSLDNLLPLLPKEKVRRSSWWDDHGEMHPFDDSGPDLEINVSLPTGNVFLTLQLGDYDWKRTKHPRQQSILVFNNGKALTNAAWSGKSESGVYERFLFSSTPTTTMRTIKHRSACTAVTSLYMDCEITLPPFPPRLKEKSPSKWLKLYEQMRNKHGQDRINMIRDSLPDMPAIDDQATSIFLHAVVQECLFGGGNHAETSLKLFRELTSIDDALAFLQGIKMVKNHHPVWDYMTVAAIMDMAHKNPNILTTRHLEQLCKNIKSNFVLTPLMEIVLNYWKNSELPTQNTYYDVMRRNKKQ